MVEDIDREHIIEELMKIRGKLKEKRVDKIASELVKLGKLSCAEGLYKGFSSPSDNNQQFIFLYNGFNIGDSDNEKYMKICKRVFIGSRSKFVIKNISLVELESPITTFPMDTYCIILYEMKRYMLNAECIYANESAKSLIKKMKS